MTEHLIAQLRRTLDELEAANDALCAKRPTAIYQAMLDAGMDNEMCRLDLARHKARTLLCETVAWAPPDT